MIALRARHQAMRIAETWFNEPVDLAEMHCQCCGLSLDWREARWQMEVECSACGAITELPPHLRFRVPPPQQQTGPLEYQALPVALRAREIVPAGRRWIRLFCLTCFSILTASAIALSVILILR